MHEIVQFEYSNSSAMGNSEDDNDGVDGNQPSDRNSNTVKRIKNEKKTRIISSANMTLANGLGTRVYGCGEIYINV